MGDERDQGRSGRCAKAVALGLLAAGAIACGHRSTPAPGKETPPPASAATAAPSASASAAASVKTIPTLTLEQLAPKGSHPTGLYAIEGALMVKDGQRVGRIVGDDIEWVGQIPKESPGFGENIVLSVHGRWPDVIGAVYETSNGRAPRPTYTPLAGKGSAYVAAEGGGLGYIRGVVRIGESILVAGYSISTGYEIVTVRGPRLFRRPLSDAEGGCKPDEVWKPYGEATTAALPLQVIESSPEGTMVSLGQLCDKRAPAAEVWDKAGKSRIVDLGRWWKKISYFPRLLKGSGDELWATSDEWSPILRYHEGAFEAVPLLDRPIRLLFVSPRGQLHAYDGQTLHRYEEGKWTAVARLAEPRRFESLALENDTFWGSTGSGVFKLREGAAAPAPEGCPAWFVYLYQASDKNEPNFTYPATRKALATFPEPAGIELVEIGERFRRHLGITVSSRAQGEAVVAHVKATMPDEDPRLFCYAPPTARKIPLNAKGK